MTTPWPYRGFGGWTEEPKLFFKRGIEGRIANGWGTKPGDYPFMARMSEEGFLSLFIEIQVLQSNFVSIP